VLCPSGDVLRRLERYGLAGRAILAPHEPVAGGPWPLRPKAPARGERLRVAVIGTLVDHKGGRTVATVAELAGGRTIEIHLIGHIDGDFPPAALRRIKVTGRYEEASLAGLIEATDPHVVWFPMSWPETYSYTLSAALEAGLPVAAPDIGAFPERLAGRPLSWIAPLGTTPAEWIDLFRTIAETLRTAAPEAATRSATEDYYARNYIAGRPRPAARSRRPRRPRIAIVPERFDIGTPTPCAYIRLIQPLSHPAITGDCDVGLADPDTILDLAPDIIVTQRFALPDIAAADRLSAHARKTGATLIYDLDDDLLAIPETHPDAATLRPRAKVVRHMLTLADIVWVSTPGLAASIAPLRPDAVLIENRLDERIWAHAPPNPTVRQAPVRILAMGTTTHDQDFDLIVPALTRLKAEYQDRVSIQVLGMTSRSDLPPGLQRIGPPISAMRSYPGFVQWLTSVQPSWDIGLAPLLDTPFNASKSPIKAMDYAALGLSVLASDTDVYRGSLADGAAGRLVANRADAWYAALDWMMRDADTRIGLAQGAHPAFLARASLASDAGLRRNALRHALQDGAGAKLAIPAA